MSGQSDLGNSRSNPLETTLTPDNVAGLRELWRFDGPATSCAPAVVDGVIYLAGWNGRVYALHLDDGSSVWTADLPDLIDSSPTNELHLTAIKLLASDKIHFGTCATREPDSSSRNSMQPPATNT